MAGHHSNAGQISVQDGRGSLRYVLVADAMEAIAPDALLEPRIRAGIRLRGRRKRCVECGIEDRDLRNSGSEVPLCGFDSFQVQAIVFRWVLREFCDALLFLG